MTIPDYQSLMRPLLAFASDGSERNINDAIKGIADQLKLTDDEPTSGGHGLSIPSLRADGI
jgi:restriction system protein